MIQLSPIYLTRSSLNTPLNSVLIISSSPLPPGDITTGWKHQYVWKRSRALGDRPLGRPRISPAPQSPELVPKNATESGTSFQFELVLFLGIHFAHSSRSFDPRGHQ